MKTIKTEIISGAMRVLASDIVSDDGIANAACIQAADRLDQQEARIKELLGEINEYIKDNLRWSRW